MGAGVGVVGVLDLLGCHIMWRPQSIAGVRLAVGLVEELGDAEFEHLPAQDVRAAFPHDQIGLGRVLRQEDLDRHLATEFDVAGAIHTSKCPLAKLANYLVVERYPALERIRRPTSYYK